VRRTTSALLCALATAAAAAPAAFAQAQIAPPGNAGVDEYLETVPDGRGNAPLDRTRPAPRRPSVPAATRRRLEGLGEDGARAAALAEAGSPRGGGRTVGGTAPPRGALGRAGDGGSGLGVVLREAAGGGDGGMGVALPVLLVVTLLGAAALALRRRRGVPAP
jgi:hypothetical protein